MYGSFHADLCSSPCRLCVFGHSCPPLLGATGGRLVSSQHAIADRTDSWLCVCTELWQGSETPQSQRIREFLVVASGMWVSEHVMGPHRGAAVCVAEIAFRRVRMCDADHSLWTARGFCVVAGGRVVGTRTCRQPLGQLRLFRGQRAHDGPAREPVAAGCDDDRSQCSGLVRSRRRPRASDRSTMCSEDLTYSGGKRASSAHACFSEAARPSPEPEQDSRGSYCPCAKRMLSLPYLHIQVGRSNELLRGVAPTTPRPHLGAR